jgi:signal transduction histidine kinase
VKSSVVVPIVLESEQTGKYQPPSLHPSAQLWGLLVSHHSKPRKVTEEELELIQAVVDQVCIAISHSILLDQVREQARQEANINNLTKVLYTSPTVKLQPALEEVVKTFNGSGGRLYLLASGNQSVEIYTCGAQPDTIDIEESRVVEENQLWQKYLYSVVETSVDQTGYKLWSVEWMRNMYDIAKVDIDNLQVNYKLWAIDDLYREPLFRTLAPFFESSRIRSLLIIPLQYGEKILGCLTIFRAEVDTEITWAGYHNPDTRQLMPRQSFEVWRQIKTNQAQIWTTNEIRYANAVGERFATAVVQYRLYQQVQALNTNLELQVQERTNNLKQAQTQLIQSEKMSSLGQLVAGIAHEINNPVNFIYGNISHVDTYTQNLVKSYQSHCLHVTQSLEEEIEQADVEYIVGDLPKLCESLRKGAERISNLVTSLRTFSRFDEAEIKKVNIHDGIESTLSLLQHRLEPNCSGAKIEIIRNYSQLPLVECFAGQLNQVFMNLLINAIDELQVCEQNFRQIIITTSLLEKNSIQISFADNGRGIKPCHQNKIFDPFFTTKPVGSGVGLGLSISYQIIEQHGGKLDCISQLNQGSKFIIEIPIQLY